MNVNSNTLISSIFNEKIRFNKRVFLLIIILASFWIFPIPKKVIITKDDIYFFFAVFILFALYFVLFGLRRQKTEVVFRNAHCDLFHHIGDEVRVIYKNIPKSDISSLSVAQRKWAGDVLSVKLRDGFVFTVENQFFNIGSDTAPQIIAFLQDQMAGTHCKISRV